MKKRLFYGGVFVILAGALAFFLFGNGTSEVPSVVDTSIVPENSTLVENGTFTVIPSESVARWEGKKTLIKDYIDTGTLGIKEGMISVSSDQFEGTVVFDMQSLKTLSTGKGGGESGLERHLKSDDFFSVEKFPTAVFVVKEVRADSSLGEYSYIAKGDLTIKGITNEIEFPVKMYIKDGLLAIEGTARVNRTLWDIRFGSDKFFNNLADNVIDDFFAFSFSLVAQKM